MVQTPKASKTPQRAKTRQHRIAATVSDILGFSNVVDEVIVEAFQAPTIGVYPCFVNSLNA